LNDEGSTICKCSLSVLVSSSQVLKKFCKLRESVNKKKNHLSNNEEGDGNLSKSIKTTILYKKRNDILL